MPRPIAKSPFLFVSDGNYGFFFFFFERIDDSLPYYRMKYPCMDVFACFSSCIEEVEGNIDQLEQKLDKVPY